MWRDIRLFNHYFRHIIKGIEKGGIKMENKNLVEAICEMVKHIHSDDALKRIYRVVSRLLKKEADE